MKKLIGLVLSFIIISLCSIYYIGKVTEEKTREIIAEYSSGDVQINIINYEKHFFTAEVTTQVSFKGGALSGHVVQVISEITHYPYKAESINHLSFLEGEINEKFNRYFSTESWFISKEEFTLWGTLKGTLLLPAGHYDDHGDVLSSGTINMNYEIDFTENKGRGKLTLPLIFIKAKTENLRLEDLVMSSTFLGSPAMSDVWQYAYDMEIGKLVQSSVVSGKITSLLDHVLLTGGSENSDTKGAVNTHNTLKIEKYKLDNKEKLEFLNNELMINVNNLYLPALNDINKNTILSQHPQSAIEALINHGFNFSISKFHSETPWGNIDGKFHLLLNKGTIFSELVANPYVLLDHGEGGVNLSVPQVFLNFPNIGNILRSLLKSGLVIVEDKNLILDGSYKNGALIINKELIPL